MCSSVVAAELSTCGSSTHREQNGMKGRKKLQANINYACMCMFCKSLKKTEATDWRAIVEFGGSTVIVAWITLYI